MTPSQPDDAGSPSPGQPPKPGQSAMPPAVVYALDCLERGTPVQVRRHMVALGYSPEEAATAVRAALAQQEAETQSAWSPDDSGARRCMSLGFLLVVCGILAGAARAFLQQSLPATVPVTLNAFAWGCVIVGLGVFLLGVVKFRFPRR